MKGTLRSANAVVPIERTLRRLFLTLFLRGRSARGLKKNAAPTSVGRKLGIVLGFYALFGMVAVSLIGQPVFVLGIYLHAFTFIAVAMFVVGSAGEVLFNKEENDILSHRPIPPRALLWAKIGVLVHTSLWLAGAINAAGFIVGVFARDGRGWFPIVHALSASLEALFCTATVVLTYQLCLRWFGRERLDSFMTATQVIVSIVLVLGSQLVPQLMMRNEGVTLVSVDRWWTLLLPPAWFAGLDDALAGSGAGRSWTLALIGIAVTSGVMWLAFGKLATDYQTGTGTMTESVVLRPTRTRRRILSRLVHAPPLRWWLRDPVSRASFLLSAAYLARDRDTKLRLYPGIAPMLVMPIVLLLPRGQYSHGPGTFGVAFAGSYLGLVPLLALGMLSLSQQWQASDIFRSAPVLGPAALSHGARRAVLVLVMLPMLLLFAAIVLLLGQKPRGLLLMLPGLVALPVYAMIPCLGGKAVPLSRPPDEAKAARRTSLTMLVMFSSAALAGIASFLHTRGYFVHFLIAETAVAATAYLFMRASLARERWASIE
ncbi:MAG: hypothetical protein ABIW79_01320 [Gemmatimonas sp.]